MATRPVRVACPVAPVTGVLGAPPPFITSGELPRRPLQLEEGPTAKVAPAACMGGERQP